MLEYSQQSPPSRWTSGVGERKRERRGEIVWMEAAAEAWNGYFHCVCCILHILYTHTALFTQEKQQQQHSAPSAIARIAAAVARRRLNADGDDDEGRSSEEEEEEEIVKGGWLFKNGKEEKRGGRGEAPPKTKRDGILSGHCRRERERELSLGQDARCVFVHIFHSQTHKHTTAPRFEGRIDISQTAGRSLAERSVNVLMAFSRAFYYSAYLCLCVCAGLRERESKHVCVRVLLCCERTNEHTVSQCYRHLTAHKLCSHNQTTTTAKRGSFKSYEFI